MSVLNQKFALFDASPVNDPTPWMVQACRAAGVFLLDINAVSALLAADPEARKVMLEHGPTGADPALAKFYRSALERLAGREEKVAMHSVVWVEYGIVPQAAVLDFDHLEDEQAKAARLGIDKGQYAQIVAHTRQQIEARLTKLAPERRLILPARASESVKAELAAKHLQTYMK